MISVAKNCALGGGDRVFLSDHMKQLWSEIGFVPTNVELDDTDKSKDDVHQAEKDISKIRESNFPSILKRPEPSARDIEQLGGITIRNIPSTLDDTQIQTFLIDS